MRGSPIIRAIILLMAVILSGLGFSKLMRPAKSIVDFPKTQDVQMIPDGIPTKIYLNLSRSVEKIELKLGEKVLPLNRVAVTRFEADLKLDYRDAVFFLAVKTADSQETKDISLFAKLVVEAQGKKTFIHTFDTLGDMDEFIEYPF